MAGEGDPATTRWFLGPGHADHLDAANDHTVRPEQLLRLLTRRLFGYRAAQPPEESPFAPVPDLARSAPTMDNGGLSPDGLTCRLTIRRGVFWDSQRPREVTAHDLVRGLKRVAHPMRPEVRRYFTETIAGLREYCEAYRATFDGNPPTAPDLAQFHMRHELTGVRAVDRETLVIHLLQPANDLPHLLAAAPAAAAPREYDYYLPDSHELMRNAPSAGPYRVAAPYRIARGLERGRDLVLEPNPRWNPDTDPVHQHPEEIIRITCDEPAGPVARRPDHPAWQLTVSHRQAASGWGVGPYLAVNLGGPPSRPTADLVVRQALSYAIDRAAVREAMAKVPGATTVVQRGLLPPGTPGYGAADAYPSAGEHGDPARARRMLADAGHPRGVRLTLAVRDSALDRGIASSLGASLAQAGVTLDQEIMAPGGFAGALRKAATRWDLALASLTPDWFGNNGRSIVGPLLRGGAEPGGANHGGYHNAAVDRLLARALAEPDQVRAATRWRELDVMIIQDLPVIPLLAHSCGPCTATAGAVPAVVWMSA